MCHQKWVINTLQKTSKKGKCDKGRSCSTWPRDPACTATFTAVTSGKDGDPTEAAGFGDRGSHTPDRAIWVCAAPRSWLQRFEFAVCATLSAAWGAAQPFTVPPAETTVVRVPPTPHFSRRAKRVLVLFFFFLILSLTKKGNVLLVGWPTKIRWRQTEQCPYSNKFGRQWVHRQLIQGRGEPQMQDWDWLWSLSFPHLQGSHTCKEQRAAKG